MIFEKAVKVDPFISLRDAEKAVMEFIKKSGVWSSDKGLRPSQVVKIKHEWITPEGEDAGRTLFPLIVSETKTMYTVQRQLK